MTTSSRLRVAVLGTGALGTLVAGHLARPAARGRVADVTVSGTWGDALATLRRDGVRITTADDAWQAPVGAVELSRLRDPFDVVLVLVKSWRTSAVAERAAAAAGRDGLVVTLQNGLGNAEILAAAAGAHRVVAGTTALGATLLAPGVVRCGGVGPTVLGGALPLLGELAALFVAAGLPTTTTDDLAAALWTKLAVNCAINPVTALAGVTNGRLLTDASLRERAVAAAREVFAVAAAGGLALGGDPGERVLAVARDTAANRSSMLQDLERGRRTEIDALAGAVVAAGERLGVATPVNAALAAAVRRAEASPLRGAA